MSGTIAKPADITLLEKQLTAQPDIYKRSSLLDQLIAHFQFIDLSKSDDLLQEQQHILQQHPNPDLQLRYHLHHAFVDNQACRYEESEYHYNQASELVDSFGNSSLQAETAIDYAGTLMNTGNLSGAATQLARAGQIIRAFPNDLLQSRLLCREGFLNLHKGLTRQAAEYLLEAESLITQSSKNLTPKDMYFLSLIQSGLGKIFEQTDEPEKSLSAYLTAVNISENAGFRTRISWHYLNAGNAYLTLQDFESAESFFQKAVKSADSTSVEAKAAAYANLAYCRLALDQHAGVADLLDQAEALYRLYGTDNDINLSNIAASRARLHAEKGENQKATEQFVTAFELARKKGDNRQLSSICQQIAGFYAQEGDFRNAYDYMVLYDNFAQKHASASHQQQVMELEARFEAEKKQQELELLRLQATRLQLKALRAQMNPHFMYNTLNAIQNLITSGKSSDASRYLAQFAQLVRQSLEYSDAEVISLESEIQFLRNFLTINQELRFGEELKFSIEVDEDLEEDLLGIPSMIIQPYVENAIEHGIRPQGGGMIRLKFDALDEQTVFCVIEDNGIGRVKSAELQESQDTRHRSMGTHITEERLRLLRELRGGMVAVDIIDMSDPLTGTVLGTRVELKIPCTELYS